MASATAETAALVREIASRETGLIAAYLFGSLARGETTARDADIALVWDSSLPAAERWRRTEAIALELELKLLPPRCVDIVDLREAAASLQHRVLSEGIRVFESDHEQRVRFEGETLSRAIDFIEWQRPFLDRWIKRVADGG